MHTRMHSDIHARTLIHTKRRLPQTYTLCIRHPVLFAALYYFQAIPLCWAYIQWMIRRPQLFASVDEESIDGAHSSSYRSRNKDRFSVRHVRHCSAVNHQRQNVDAEEIMSDYTQTLV